MFRLDRVAMTVLTLGLVLGTVSAASASARGPEELEPFLLTAAELGSGFTEDEDAPDPNPPPSYLRGYSRTTPSRTAVVTMLLSEDRHAPRTWVEILQLAHGQDDSSAELYSDEGLVPGGFGGDAWALPMVGRVADRDAAALIIAWRSADITAVMDVLAERAPGESDEQLAARVVTYPLRQRDKIRALLTAELQAHSSTATVSALVARAMPSAPPAPRQVLTAPSRDLFLRARFLREAAHAGPGVGAGDADGLTDHWAGVPRVV